MCIVIGRCVCDMNQLRYTFTFDNHYRPQKLKVSNVVSKYVYLYANTTCSNIIIYFVVLCL